MKNLKPSITAHLLSIAISSCAVITSLNSNAQDSLTVISWGGAFSEAQKKHMLEPFERDSGVRVMFDTYTGGIAEIKAQVQSGKTQWDVIDVDSFTLERACSEGLLEPLDHSQLPAGADGTNYQDDFLPNTLSECGIATWLYSLVIGYNKNTIGAVPPSSIADIFDTAKIPGKRGFQRKAIGLLEWALLADGVSREQVYQQLATETGQQRAFNKLSSIKNDIVWYDAYSQAPQLLNDGSAVLVQIPHGRIYNAVRNQNSPFAIIWDGHVYDYDIWAIVKGTSNLELAKRFLSHATGSLPLAGSADLAYSPSRRSSLALMDRDDLLQSSLPTSHLELGIQSNPAFWADYGQTLDEKFADWLLKN